MLLRFFDMHFLWYGKLQISNEITFHSHNNCVGTPTITFITNNTTTFEGNKLSLRCNVTNDEDAINPLTVAWYKSDGTELNAMPNHLLLYNTTNPGTGEVQLVLLFDPVHYSDSEKYTCHALNDKDCFTQAKTKLTVECKSTIFVINLHVATYYKGTHSEIIYQSFKERASLCINTGALNNEL